VDGQLTHRKVQNLDVIGFGEVVDVDGRQVVDSFGWDLCTGSPREVAFTELPTPSIELDRHWTDQDGYGETADWEGQGSLVEAAWPTRPPR
jgi:hypothetical protein